LRIGGKIQTRFVINPQGGTVMAKNRAPIFIGGALLVLLPLLGLNISCTVKTIDAVPNIQPSLPPQYYACYEAAPDDLLRAYTRNYMSEQLYKGAAFVFKRIVVDKRMLLNKDKGYLDVSKVQCIAAQDSDLSKLAVGQTIDVVGIAQGPIDGMSGWMRMSGCYFLTTGLIQLPAGGGGTLPPSY
jgi:hypothetical protein